LNGVRLLANGGLSSAPIKIRAFFFFSCSLHGADQLQKDFAVVDEWLRDNITPDGVRQSVLALDAFHYLQGAVALLKRQPPSQREGRRIHKPLCEFPFCSFSAILMHQKAKIVY
jgi:hypothetical protein